MITLTSISGVISDTNPGVPVLRRLTPTHPRIPTWSRVIRLALAAVLFPTVSAAQPRAVDIAGLRIRATIDYARFPNFERVAGTQVDIQSYTADNAYLGAGLGFDVDLTRLPIRLQAGLSYGTQRFTQDYSSSNVLSPSHVDGNVRALFTDFGIAYRYPLAHFLLLAGGGGTWARNSSTFTSTYVNCSDCDVTTSRVLNRLRPRIEVGGEFTLRPDVRLRTTLGHVGTFNSDDADDHTHLSIGLSYNFHRFE